MPISDLGDPRLQELFGPDTADSRVKPVVRLSRSSPPPWLLAAIAIAAAIFLFWLLQSSREVQQEPQVRVRGDLPDFSAEPPELYIPRAAPPRAQPQVTASPPRPVPVANSGRRQMRAPAPQMAFERPLGQFGPVPPRAAGASAGPSLVIDSTAPGTPVAASQPAAVASPNSQWGGRARASTLANPSNTVAQGTLIPAVLETALNSTSSGLARAVVSRDVRGFDGKKVLIPRGSRLVGEYGGNAVPGQNRALIRWVRLILPGGATVALDSPATDSLGRGGVRASVDTHFWTRLVDTVLGSAASIGTALGTRVASGSVLVAVPGSVHQPQESSQENRAGPTLNVKAGKSIGVFVARDLEFPDAGTAG